MSLVNGFIFSTIIETIEGFLSPLITTVLGLLAGFPVWIQCQRKMEHRILMGINVCRRYGSRKHGG